ncbi:MAG: heavy-metal-associated domain-containing protein [Dehalococcoidia bacterium]
MQFLLSSPEITCEHCIATIREATNASGVARFISGDANARTFVVDVESGAALDRISSALAEAGYPLGPVDGPAPDEVHAASGLHPNLTTDWKPAAYRVERTEAGANVNYDCYCGCDAGFALDRSRADPPPESCCCGNVILVGRGAGAALPPKLETPGRFRLDVRSITMPWGQPMEVALAVPSEA